MMPWRLIGFIILLGIFLVFIAFNLGNTCDINFGFRVFNEVPVFLTAFASFVLGMLCAIPFAISLRLKKKDRHGTAREIAPELSPPKPKKKWGKAREEVPEISPPPPGDEGPYGVN
jgi:uncharacterized integral membrane protein